MPEIVIPYKPRKIWREILHPAVESHRFSVLVFVMAEIDITVGGCVTSGNDAETEQRKQDRVHYSPEKGGFSRQCVLYKDSNNPFQIIPHFPVARNLFIISHLRIILCAFCAEDYT